MKNKLKLGLDTKTDLMNPLSVKYPDHGGFYGCACLEKYCANRCQNIQVIEEIGSGNGGTVSQISNNGVFMAKKVFVQKPKTNGEISQLLKEIEKLISFDSTFIIKTHGLFYDKNITLLMEYADLGSLDKLFEKISFFPELVVVKVTKHILEGLTYLFNEHKISHRDIKPGNILLNSKGEIKLCDFGVCISEVNDAYSFLRSPQVNNRHCCGTLAYLSPELIKHELILHNIQEQQADIWSLGVTILHLLCGFYPFPMRSIDIFEKTHANNSLGIAKIEPKGHLKEIPNSSLIFFEESSWVEPRLPAKFYSNEINDFTSRCLKYRPENRATLDKLMVHDFTIKHSNSDTQDTFNEWLKIVASLLKK